MKELRDIITAYGPLAEAGRSCALATVVRVEGSSYRQPGARMLVTDTGEIVAGCVSGGCLEADVAEWGRRVIQSGAPRLLTYDTSADEDDADFLFGVGTGCEGIIEILVERLEGRNPVALLLPATALNENSAAIVATVYRASSPDVPPIGSRRLIDRGGCRTSGSLGDRFDGDILTAAREALRISESRWIELGDSDHGVSLFCELVRPELRIVLCGAGPDSLPLARMAHLIGWRVVVVDHRPSFANFERFPMADEIIVARPEQLAGRLALDSRCAVIVMTHNYLLDRELLSHFASSPAFYIGLLGSRKRFQRLLGDLQDSDIDLQTALGARLHAPVGLEIGADTPNTIALSVTAEIQSAIGRRSARISKEERLNGTCLRTTRLTHCPISV